MDLKPRDTQRGQRLMLVESGLVAAMMASVSGLFLTGLVVELGGEAPHVGWLQSAMLIGGVFQVSTNWILDRVGSRKRFCLAALGTVRLLRAMIAALPLLALWGLERSLLLGPLAALMLVGGVFGMSAEAVRQSWIADLVPVSMRGRFFGRRVQIAGAVTMIAVPAYAWFVDAWQDAGREPLVAFQLVIAFGVGSGFASLWCIWKLPEPPLHRNEKRTSLLRSLALPFGEQQFRRFIALRSSFSFAAGMCAGFFYFFMLRFLGMSYIQIALTEVLSQLVGLLAAPLWGRLADRWGTRRLLVLALSFKAIFPFLWLGLLPQWWYLVFAVVLVRVFNTAQQIGFLNLALRLAPQADRAAYLSVERGCHNLARAAAPAIAGALAAAIGDAVWQVGALTFTALHVLMFLSGVLRVASLAWLRGMREPEEAEVNQMDVDEDELRPSD